MASTDQPLHGGDDERGGRPGSRTPFQWKIGPFPIDLPVPGEGSELAFRQRAPPDGHARQPAASLPRRGDAVAHVARRAHPWPISQGAHSPPQSTSLSPALATPSLQLAGAHAPSRQIPSSQSLSAAHSSIDSSLGVSSGVSAGSAVSSSCSSDSPGNCTSGASAGQGSAVQPGSAPATSHNEHNTEPAYRNFIAHSPCVASIRTFSAGELGELRNRAKPLRKILANVEFAGCLS